MCAVSMSSAALAGDRHRERPDVDIDSLDAELLRDGAEWVVQVRYKVEIDDAHPQDLFTLGLQIKERGHALVDANGQVCTTFVPLERPTVCDGEELTFEAYAEVRQPLGAIRCPDDLRVQSFVILDGDSCWLDDESTSVEYCRPRVVVEHVRPAPVVDFVRPAPVAIVRPAPIVEVHRPVPRLIATRPAYPAPVVVRERHAGGFVGVRVRHDDVRVRVGARW
jgi:hypothetical protein